MCETISHPYRPGSLTLAGLEPLKLELCLLHCRNRKKERQIFDVANSFLFYFAKPQRQCIESKFKSSDIYFVGGHLFCDLLKKDRSVFPAILQREKGKKLTEEK